MAQPRLLTSGETAQVLMALDNGELLSALRKMSEFERAFWRDQGDAEALNGHPNMERMVEFAARASQAGNMEQIMRKAVGL